MALLAPRLGGSSSSLARGWVQQSTRQAFGASSSSQAWGMDATSVARLVSILGVGRRKQLDVSPVICLVPCRARGDFWEDCVI